MKVVSSKQMAALEAQAYRNGSSEEGFMEEAGKGVAHAIENFIAQHFVPHQVYLLCGKGNNAGDAYVAGTYLLEKGYSVLSYQIASLADSSPLCRKNSKRFLKLGGQICDVSHPEEIQLSKPGVIVDALFGTGFHGTAKEPYASAIQVANQSRLPILAIDIPSGLDGETGIVEGIAIHAKETIFLGLPKTGFFLQDGWNHVGKLRHVDFGLPMQYVEEWESEMWMLSPEIMAPLLPSIVNTRHKYQAGYVVGLSGSPGMPGAALLASAGALKAGAGIVKLFHPEGMEAELSSSPYEIIKIPYDIADPSKMIEMMNNASAVFVGPGIGRTAEARELLGNVLPNLEKPCVVDADALTLIAEGKIPLPSQSILTPHVGEMMCLLKRSAPKPGTKEFLEACRGFVEETGVTLVLKGGPSFIFQPEEPIMVNPCGDPGMATAGSGDVLTGVITGLLAQGLSLSHAASLGVYLHGLSGEFAAETKTSYCLIASDLLECLPDAFHYLSEAIL